MNFSLNEFKEKTTRKIYNDAEKFQENFKMLFIGVFKTRLNINVGTFLRI